jgi:hypothetical protein
VIPQQRQRRGNSQSSPSISEEKKCHANNFLEERGKGEANAVAREEHDSPRFKHASRGNNDSNHDNSHRIRSSHSCSSKQQQLQLQQQLEPSLQNSIDCIRKPIP